MSKGSIQKNSLHLGLCKSTSRRILSLPRGDSEPFGYRCLVNYFSLFMVCETWGRVNWPPWALPRPAHCFSSAPNTDVSRLCRRQTQRSLFHFVQIEKYFRYLSFVSKKNRSWGRESFHFLEFSLLACEEPSWNCKTVWRPGPHWEHGCSPAQPTPLLRGCCCWNSLFLQT